MSLKDVIGYGAGIVGIIGGAVGAVWIYITTRKNKNIEAEKTDAEKEEIRFNLRMKQEKYELEKENIYQNKINSINQQFEQMEKQMEAFKKLYEEALVVIKELKSELNLHKTVRS